MAFSVYSLRISNDLPVQSDYIPRITYFFTFSILINLLVLTWFVQLNFLKVKENLPRVYEILVNFILKMNCKKVNKEKIEPVNDKINEVEANSSKNVDVKVEMKKKLEKQFEIINYLIFYMFTLITLLTIILIFCSP
jgi:hypothetical protein